MTMEAVWGQRREKMFHTVYYASKTLDEAPKNYTTTEKELLVVVFTFDKFRHYLVLSKVSALTDFALLLFFCSVNRIRNLGSSGG